MFLSVLAVLWSQLYIDAYPDQVMKSGTGAVAQSFGEGDVVGVGWHGGRCLNCEAGTDGDFACCENHGITGININGGFQE